MHEWSESVVIGCPPEVAFTYLANPETASIVDPAVVSYEPEGGRIAAGVRNHIRVRMLGLPVTMVSETLEYVEGRRMVMESIEPARPMVGRATHLFEPHPEGTRYTWQMDFTPTVPGGRFIAKLFSAFMRRNARAQQARLKAVLEAT